MHLAIVNERKVDAHASVRPMDVWLLLREPDPKDPEQKVPEVSHNSTVRVKVPDDCDWIRMVMVPRAEMEVGHWQAQALSLISLPICLQGLTIVRFWMGISPVLIVARR